MSKKENAVEQTEKKVMTKYDLKMQKRQKAKENAKKQKRAEKLIWAVVIVAVVALIASFPIRSYMAVNESYIKVNGEDITRVEFDYNYNVVKNNYLAQYGSYLSMFGVDATSDLSTQMYSDTMSWKDFFEQQAVSSIISGKALIAEAEAAGFTCDIEEEYAEYVAEIEEQAQISGLSVKNFVKTTYGPYATLDRIEEYIRESLWTNAYYIHLEEQNAPTDDEILAYYEADKNAYDSVDYYLTTIDAVLPTEPTELADPVEETENAEEETAYQPSEAEIEKAMADAKVLADAAQATVTTDGELQENIRYTAASTYIRDWLFDTARTAGDTTVIENPITNQYYVVSFVSRYLDESPTANVRIIMTTAANGQAILDEWKNGEATEDSFAALADQYNAGTTFTSEGGLYEGVAPTGTLQEISDWLFEGNRTAGETTVVVAEDGSEYVLYYAGPNHPLWKMNIKSEIMNAFFETHIEEISASYEVEDTKGNLKYLEILEAQEAAAAEAETATVEAE